MRTGRLEQPCLLEQVREVGYRRQADVLHDDDDFHGDDDKHDDDDDDVDDDHGDDNDDFDDDVGDNDVEDDNDEDECLINMLHLCLILIFCCYWLF